MPYAKRGKRNIMAGFVLSTLILLASSAASYFSVAGLISSQAWVRHTDEVEAGLGSVVSLMKDVETGQRGFLLAQDESFLEPYNAGRDSVWGYFDSAKSLTQDNERQQEALGMLSLLIHEKLQLAASTVAAKKESRPVTVGTLLEGKAIMDSIRLVIKAMTVREQQLMVARTESTNRFAQYTPVALVASSLLALTVTVIFYRRIKKRP